MHVKQGTLCKALFVIIYYCMLMPHSSVHMKSATFYASINLCRCQGWWACALCFLSGPFHSPRWVWRQQCSVRCHHAVWAEHGDLPRGWPCLEKRCSVQRVLSAGSQVRHPQPSRAWVVTSELIPQSDAHFWGGAVFCKTVLVLRFSLLFLLSWCFISTETIRFITDGKRRGSGRDE